MMASWPPAAPVIGALLTGARARRDIEARQLSRLRRLLRHAQSNVPFYGELFHRHGVRPEDIRTLEDVARIPITDKPILRRQPVERTVASGTEPDALIPRATSGSAGEPFVVRRTWLEQSLQHLSRVRAQRALGLRLTDRFAAIGLVRAPDRRNTKIVGRTLSRLGIYRRARIDAFEEADVILSRLVAMDPACISGYPGILAGLADLNRDCDRPVRPRIAFTGGEVLAPHLRNRIESGFGTRAFDLYGCHEINLVSWECPTTGHQHTCDDDALVEVVRDGQPAREGESGEIVITSLLSYAMPFIRYPLGDVAVRGPTPCPCGQPFATLSALEGRTFEYFDLPGGRRLHAHQLGTALTATADWIRHYQLVQEQPDRIVARVVPTTRNPAPDTERLRAAANHVLGGAVRFEVILADEIPPDENGKSRLYRSLVTIPPECQPAQTPPGREAGPAPARTAVRGQGPRRG